jgi:hypothetical protein
MSKALLSSIALLMIMVACNKDKFQTTPSIEIKSVSTETIQQGENIAFNLEFTDKEGDLGNGEFLCILTRINLKPIGSGGNPIIDTFRTALPDFPDKRKGQITYDALGYDNFNGDPNDNDSFYIKFAVADAAGNKSDTISTNLIIAKQQ